MARTLSGLPRHESAPGRAGALRTGKCVGDVARRPERRTLHRPASTTTYSDAGAARRRAISASPDQRRIEQRIGRYGLRHRANPDPRTPGSWRRGDRGLADHCLRTSVVVDDDDPVGTGLLRAAYRFGEWKVGSHRDRASGSARVPRCRAADRARPAAAAPMSSSPTSTRRRASPTTRSVARSALDWAAAQARRRRRTRNNPARPAGAEGAGAHVAADPPDQRAQELPAIERQARQQVVYADDRVAPGDSGGEQDADAAGRQPAVHDAGSTRDHEVRQRPDDSDRGRVPRLDRFTRQRRMAGQEAQRNALRPGSTACAPPRNAPPRAPGSTTQERRRRPPQRHTGQPPIPGTARATAGANCAVTKARNSSQLAET